MTSWPTISILLPTSPCLQIPRTPPHLQLLQQQISYCFSATSFTLMFLYISGMTKRHTEGYTDVIIKVLASGMFMKSCVSESLPLFLFLLSLSLIHPSFPSDLPYIRRSRSIPLYLSPQNTINWFFQLPSSLSIITSERERTFHRTKTHRMLTIFTTAMQTMILRGQAKLSTIFNLATSHSLLWTLVVIVPH